MPETLRALILAEAPMRPAHALQLALQLLEALGVLHADGVRTVTCDPSGCSSVTDRWRSCPAWRRPPPRSRIFNGATCRARLPFFTRREPSAGTPASQRTPAVLPPRLDAVIARGLDIGDGAFDATAAFAQELRVCQLDALGTARKQRF